MIQLQQSTHPSTDVKVLYDEAFPLAERRPWPAQLRLLAERKLQLVELRKEGQFAGFVFYWSLPSFSFIEYIAIAPAARGGGAGTYVMQLMADKLGPIVLEVEPPDTEQAIRRIHFYERLGYQTFPDPYEQPPHHPGHGGLPLRLMYLHLPTDLQFKDIKQTLYKEVYQVT
ncbi:MAG: GNAT family N-acetyltransferase [Chitinophaga sp.]|uniref:GNAT family N-acetyltransferase n=1 Tax=Chitinophaga sp. TaxID=1869181 RepID=UPI0025BE8307|nr:GNAT family N-acetyltransferase [Chitinophaga sp.]MBV8255827.1 GNAT family N-acetyltransferase [Chitinophaga sp.]